MMQQLQPRMCNNAARVGGGVSAMLEGSDGRNALPITRGHGELALMLVDDSYKSWHEG
jgi:hypothetical protein